MLIAIKLRASILSARRAAAMPVKYQERLNDLAATRAVSPAQCLISGSHTRLLHDLFPYESAIVAVGAPVAQAKSRNAGARQV
jgi:hypothetical protein